jgi:hypothetical protein
MKPMLRGGGSVSTRPTIAVLSSDSLFVANVTSTLDLLSFYYRVIDQPRAAMQALNSDQFNVCIFDEQLAVNNIALLDLACGNSNNVICTSGDEFATIRLLEMYPKVNHVFGKNKPYYHVELTTALNKIISGSIAGIEQYLSPQASITRLVVDDYSKRSAYLDRVESFAKELNCFPDFPEMVATVTWELLMNAMFDAPYDPVEGVAKYANWNRNKPLKMQAGEEVQLSFGADESSFVVAVGDNFGRLTRDTVVDCLVRCSKAGHDQIREGTAGAGVGLYMMFNSISQINFNIDPGRRTEVIFAVFLSKRMKDFVLRARSVNFYLGIAS